MWSLIHVYLLLPFRGNENWLSLDRKVLDHDLPRYADPIIFFFAVRFVILSSHYSVCSL